MSDRALVNANVHPMTHPDTRAEAIAWKGGVVLAVGSNDDVTAAANQHGIPVEDAAGHVVVPGFVDAHMHFLHVGLKRIRPQLEGAKDRSEALQRVADWITAHPGDSPVIAEGWDESDWPDRQWPTRQELDGHTQRPLVLRRIDGHIAVANTPATRLARARWDQDDLVNTETGVLLEDASLYLNEVMPATDAELDKAVQVACQVAHSLGVTGVGDYEQAPLRAALVRAARANRLSVRLSCSIYVQNLEDALAEGFRTGRRHGPSGNRTGDEGSVSRGPEADTAGMADGPARSDWLRDGGLKVFHDGSFGGRTAWLHEPYVNSNSCGMPIWSDQEIDDLYRRAHAAGIQLHAHAIGDAAIAQALEGMERLRSADPDGWQDNQLLHRIEHYELPTDDDVERTCRLGVVGSCQPNFVGAWSAKGGMYEDRLGARFWRNNRYRTWIDQGLRLAFGSDGMPFGPLWGIQSAVQHPVPEERITPAEAVWLYTERAAWSLHWGDAMGRLEPGKRADVLLLDVQDLDERPPAEWVIRETIVDGRTVHRSEAPRLAA